MINLILCNRIIYSLDSGNGLCCPYCFNFSFEPFIVSIGPSVNVWTLCVGLKPNRGRNLLLQKNIMYFLFILCINDAKHFSKNNLLY